MADLERAEPAENGRGFGEESKGNEARAFVSVEDVDDAIRAAVRFRLAREARHLLCRVGSSQEAIRRRPSSLTLSPALCS